MAPLPLLFSFSSIICLLSLTASATTTQTTSTLGKDQVPSIMCNECELPPPPPIRPPEKKCPPPPSPPPPRSPPPPPSPPPPSPPPPVVECPPPPLPLPPVVECPPPPPPKPPCGDGVIHCLLPPVLGTPDEPNYLLPPHIPYPPLTSDLDYIVNGAKMIRFSNPNYFSLQSFIFLILLCLPYYLFI